MPVIHAIDQAPASILLHLAAALTALLLGGVVLFGHKGTYVHRMLGRLWVGLMLVVAIGSFWIQGRGHFGWIHLLSVVVIVNLAVAVYSIRIKNVRRHRLNMRMAYLGLCVAGVFTLLPYRMLGKLVWGS